ncbi:MAG: VWA domain-containing protein [Thermoanaerobaculia bacterium]|nr:VWA domain-containing protein [Thermoanaerobaculia bacterium]
MRRPACLIVPALLAWPLAGLAQEPGAFRDRVDVEVVNIDVAVTDRSGQSVRNLGRDDFRLVVDGDKVPIRYFDPPAEESGRRESLVLMVDDRHLAPDAKRLALGELEAPLLALARTGCQIQIVSFEGTLRVLQRFTVDGDAIRVGLARATRSGNEASQRMWRERQSAVDYVVSNLTSFSRTPPEELIEQTYKAVLSQLRDYAQYEHEDGKELVGALQLTLASLGGVPGHKTVILLSDGFAIQPVDKVFDRFARFEKRLSQTDPTEVRAPEDLRIGQRPVFSQSIVPKGAQDWRRGYEDLDIVDDVLALGTLANAGRVTVHTVPLTPTFLIEVERGLRVELGQERFVISDLDESLAMIANATGGRAHDRAGDLAAFVADTLEDIPGTYSLGFAPPVADAEHHEVKVRVKGRGLRTRHRPGYVARRFEQRLGARTLAALTLDMVDNPHGLGIRIEGLEPLAEGVQRVSIVAEVPIDALELTSDGSRHFADLWAAATFLDPATGGVGDMRTVQASLVIPDEDLETALAQSFGAVLSLRMPAGRMPTAIGIWNRTSGRSSFIAGNVDVLPPPPGPPDPGSD